MKTKINILIILITLSFASCHSNKKSFRYVNVNGFERTICKNGEGAKFDINKIIILKEIKQVHLGSIEKVSIIDSLIVVKDKYGVYLFNSNGKYLRQIGRKGLANNEYINLSTYYVDNRKNINIVDGCSSKILTFRTDGTFLNSKKIKDGLLMQVFDMEPLLSNQLFVCNKICDDFNDIYGICTDNLNNFKMVDNTPLKTRNYLMPIGGHPFSVYNNIIRYVKPFGNCIYTYGSNKVWEIKTKMKVLDDDNLEDIKILDPTLYIKVLSKKYFVGFTDIFETSKYILLAFSQVEYVMLNKKNNTCQVYDYSLSHNSTNAQLINIMATYNDQLVGIVEPFFRLNISLSKGNEALFKALEGRKSFKSPAIIIYDINK